MGFVKDIFMNKNAFTLLELSVVVIIVGILSVVAIPNMLKTVNRGYAKDALNNLMAIYAAQQDYAQNHGGAYIYCGNTGSTTDFSACLNSGLGTNIIPRNSMVYTCEDSGSNALCQARKDLEIVFRINTRYSITTSLFPVYCDGTGGSASASQNPCCWNDGTHGNGTSCP
jgi:prepilin-type N-terminal cleavage/methylation domain-containing protein